MLEIDLMETSNKYFYSNSNISEISKIEFILLKGKYIQYCFRFLYNNFNDCFDDFKSILSSYSTQ